MAAGPSHPRQDRVAPSLPAAPLCSPMSPRGSAGRAPGARRRSRPCRRGSAAAGGCGCGAGSLGRQRRRAHGSPPRCPPGAAYRANNARLIAPPPRAGGTRGAARRGPSSRRQQAGLPRRARSAAAEEVPQARASHAGKVESSTQPPRRMPEGREQRRGAPTGQLRASPPPLRSGRPGTCGGARPCPGN